jgi:hypothetical protein
MSFGHVWKHWYPSKRTLHVVLELVHFRPFVLFASYQHHFQMLDLSLILFQRIQLKRGTGMWNVLLLWQLM